MRATPDGWKHEPFTTGLAVPYAERFSQTEYTRLQEGLIPRVMEDKWFVYFDKPYLLFHRSWTGKPVYRVKLLADAEGATVAEALCVSDVFTENGPAYQVELLDFLICILLLGKAKPFPLPSGFVDPAKGLLQHAVSGTGYVQKQEPRKAESSGRRWLTWRWTGWRKPSKPDD